MESNNRQPVPVDSPVAEPKPPTKASKSKTKRVLLVLFIVVMLLGSACGVYRWQHKKVSELNIKVGMLQGQIMQLSKEVSKQTTATTSATDASSATSQKYLVISPLGIKLPLSSTIEDLTYTYDGDAKENFDPSVNGGGGASLHFSAKSISSFCPGYQNILGTYRVYSTKQTNPGPSDIQVGTLEAQVNGYYIYYHHVQDGCAPESEQSQIGMLIDPLLKSVQAAKVAS